MATALPTSTTQPNALAAVTMCEAFQITAADRPDDVALRTHDGRLSLTWAQYAERARRVAGGLASLGIGRGDTVALMTTNRPEFHVCDTAAFHLGATPFSVYNTSSPEQIAYLFSNAQNRVVILEQQFLEVVRGALSRSSGVEHIVCVDGAAEGTISLDALEARAPAEFDLATAAASVQPDDALTLIYTSGTTGAPKGVQTTHANMIAQCRGAAAALPIPMGARVTSYLPLAHIADRWAHHYNSIVFGFEITCVPDPKLVASVLPQVRPTFWGCVPRILEKMKAALEVGIANEPDDRARNAMLDAIEIGRARARHLEAGDTVPEDVAMAFEAAEAQVLSKLRARIGLDETRCVIVGAAATPPPVYEFFRAIGLPITEIYGMSEASCLMTATPPDEARIGTVGRALPNVELKLADDGELLCRGPIVMKGYRNDPERTAEAVDAEGWLHTGDIAQIDDDGYVKIVDRKKELIINAGGKNMSPTNIEGALKSSSPFIGLAVAIGDGRPYNTALIVLDAEVTQSWAAREQLADPSPAALARDDRVVAEVQRGIDAANAQLSRVEQIKKFTIVEGDWAPGGDELTPTMKLKRKPIAEKYAQLIERMYAG